MLSLTKLKEQPNLRFLERSFPTEHLRWLFLKSKKFLLFSAFCYDYVAFCLKHVALQTIQISFSSNGNWKENIHQRNGSFARLKFAEWRSAFNVQIFNLLIIQIYNQRLTWKVLLNWVSSVHVDGKLFKSVWIFN